MSISFSNTCVPADLVKENLSGKFFNLKSKNFKLDCGEVLDLSLGCYEIGNPQGPLVIIHPPLSASCQVALTDEALKAGELPTQTRGWWQGVVCPGGAIDSNVYRVLCCDHLLGLSNYANLSGGNSASDYPDIATKITPVDTARFVALGLKSQLKITSVHAVVGCSLGGAAAGAWPSISDETGVKVSNIISISGPIPEDSRSQKLFELQQRVLHLSTNSELQIVRREHNSIYPVRLSKNDNLTGYEKALSSLEADFIRLAEFLDDRISNPLIEDSSISQLKVVIVRKLGLLSFVTPEYFARKEARLLQRGSSVEDWFTHLADSYSQQVNARELSGLLAQIVSPSFSSELLYRGLKNSESKFFYFASQGDLLFLPELAQKWLDRLKSFGLADRLNFDFSPDLGTFRGHDFFLCPQYVKSSGYLELKNAIDISSTNN